MNTIWIVKGATTEDPNVIEWQFSDGPAGARGSSSDFIDLREGLEAHRGYQFNLKDADFTPEERAIYDEVVGPNIDMLMEAAACMWEHALHLIQKDDRWRDYQEGWGYASARMETIQHAPLLEADYQSVKDTYDSCFDWEFVPEWMEENLYFDESAIRCRETRVIPTRD